MPAEQRAPAVTKTPGPERDVGTARRGYQTHQEKVRSLQRSPYRAAKADRWRIRPPGVSEAGATAVSTMTTVCRRKKVMGKPGALVAHAGFDGRAVETGHGTD